MTSVRSRGQVDSAEQQKRFKRTAALQEIYMGQWEVSNEAVNIAMTELRNQDDAGAGDIMKCLESDVARLQSIMFDEQRRQESPRDSSEVFIKVISIIYRGDVEHTQDCNPLF